MISKIVRFALKNATAVLLVAALVTAAGISSAVQLRQESMPDASIPMVVVAVPYPGAAPSDVLKDITKPMGDAISGVAGVTEIDGTSSENVGVIVAQFDYSKDMKEAQRDIQDAIAKVTLPQGAMSPTVERISFGSFPMLRLSISNPRLSGADLERAVRDTVLPKIQSSPGVAQANLLSDSKRAVYVEVLPDELAKHKMQVTDVSQQVQANMVSFPVGSVDIKTTTYPIRVTAEQTTLSQLKGIRIPLQPDTAAMLAKAFKGIGQGFAGLAQGMQGLGQGMLGLGQGMQGLGLGLYGSTQALNGAVQLTNGIISLQNQITLLEIEQAHQQGIIDNHSPDSTATIVVAAHAKLPMLAGQIAGMTAAEQQMQATLGKLQKALGSMPAPAGAATSKSSSSSSGGMSMSGGGSSNSLSSSSSMSTAVKTVTLGEVADVSIGTGPQGAYTRTNGDQSVLIEVVKSQDANTVVVADDLKRLVPTLTEKMPAGTKVVYTYDGSDSVKSSVSGMVREGLLGALFAVIVILIFLRDWRATLISVVSIPLSLLVAIMFLGTANITLNVMSLGGLAVAIGRVVDDSIVVIENIYRHLGMAKPEECNDDLIVKAVSEVGGAITSSTLTTMGVFLPLGLVSGLVGKLFMPFAATVTLALAASLVVALTVVPLLAKFFLVRRGTLAGTSHAPKQGRVIQWYTRVLTWALDHKWAVLLSAVAITVAAIALIPVVGTGFMPQTKEKYIAVDVSYPEGTSVDTTNRLSKQLETVIGRDPQVLVYQTSVGAVQGQISSSGIKGSNNAEVWVRLKDNANTDATIARWRRLLVPLAPKGVVTVNDAGNRTSGATNEMDVQVVGDDINAVRAVSEEITRKLAAIHGLEDPSNNLGSSKPEFAVNVDQHKAAPKGLSGMQVAMFMRQMLSSDSIAKMTVQGQDLDVKLGIKLDPVRGTKQIGDLAVMSPLGKAIKIRDIATVTQKPGPVTIYTKDGTQYAIVKASMGAKDSGKVTSDVKAMIAGLNLPKGVTVSVGGTAKMMSDTFSSLGWAMIAAIGTVYLVMVLTFGEAAAPLAILVSLPLAAIGSVFGLLVVGQPLNMPAMIGELMLIGIVVTNAIVLVSRIQDNRRLHGMSTRDAILEAGPIRMRPILMTAFATVFALLPLAAGMAEGALISQSLAAAVIGGLVSSTMLTLIVVPTAFEFLENLKDRMGISGNKSERQRAREARKTEIEAEPQPEM